MALSNSKSENNFLRSRRADKGSVLDPSQFNATDIDFWKNKDFITGTNLTLISRVDETNRRAQITAVNYRRDGRQSHATRRHSAYSLPLAGIYSSRFRDLSNAMAFGKSTSPLTRTRPSFAGTRSTSPFSSSIWSRSTASAMSTWPDGSISLARSTHCRINSASSLRKRARR